MKIAIASPMNVHTLARAHGVSTEDIAPGLGSTATTPLVLELLARGHEVTVFTLCNRLLSEKKYQWGKLTVYVCPLRPKWGPRTFFAKEVVCLRRKVREVKPDFVHAHWTYEYALGPLLAGTPTIVTIHDLPWNVLRHFRDYGRTFRLMMAYGVAALATRYTAVSSVAADHFRRYLRPGTKIEIIPNFLPNDVVRASNGPRTHAGRPLRFATTIQGFTRLKNATAALEAFAELRKRVPGAELSMYGLDHQPGGLAQQWAEQHGCAAGVRFVGPLAYPQLQESLKKDVDVLIVPSLDESFSLSTLEAMALGIPVIANEALPAVKNLLGNGVAGILTDVNNAAECARRMADLQQDPQLYARLSAGGVGLAFEHYTAERVISQYEALYKSFLQTQSR